MAVDVRSTFNVLDQKVVEHLLGKFLDRFLNKAPKLVHGVEEALLQGFAVFRLPASDRRRLLTTNLVERLNEEIRRCTRGG